MTKFKTDDFLGKAVKNTRMFCSIGLEPIKDMFQLRFAAGGNKFSQLCGFIFDSANESIDYPRFAIAFVCKLRSKIYRQQNTNPSMWYIFKKISKERVDVLDEKQLLVNYGFDIKKFFQSDMFKAAIPAFEKTLKKGLADCESFAAKLEGTEAKEATKFINAIKESMPLLKSTRVNDKYYKLNDLDAIDAEVDRIEKKTADDKKKELDKKFKEIGKMNKSIMSKANHQEQSTTEESEETNESFDQFDWKNGSLTGKGVKQAIDSFKAQDGETQTTVIYDRATRKFYNIVDVHMAPVKSGHGIEFDIDTTKAIQKECEDMKDNKEKENKVNEEVDDEGEEFISLSEMIEEMQNAYPNNKEGGMHTEIYAIVNGKSERVSFVKFLKASDRPDSGRFIIADSSAASKAEFEKMKKEFNVKESEEKKDDNKEEVSEKEAEEIKFESMMNADIDKALEEIYG